MTDITELVDLLTQRIVAIEDDRADDAPTDGQTKDNLAAVVAPAVTDDKTGFFGIGSLWLNTTTNDFYLCADNTTGAAVWKLIT